MRARKLMMILFIALMSLLVTQCSSAPEEVAPPAPAEVKAADTAEVQQPVDTAPADAAPADAAQQSALDPQMLLETRCTRCHGLQKIESASKDAAGWNDTVAKMVGMGAELTPEEQDVVVQYLAETYP